MRHRKLIRKMDEALARGRRWYWRPIHDPPVEAGFYLVHRDFADAEGYLDADHHEGAHSRGLPGELRRITHWRPLPEDPGGEPE